MWLKYTEFVKFKVMTDQRACDDEQMVAYRCSKLNQPTRRGLIWLVHFKGERIGEISKQDSRFVHDNWVTKTNVEHPFISRESRRIVDDELQRLKRKVMKAYHDRDSDLVV